MPDRRFSYPETASAVLLIAALMLAAFFHGTQDALYAPIMMCLSLAGLIAWTSYTKTGMAVPSGLLPAALAALWGYLALSLSWSQTPYISLYFFFIFSIAPFLFFTLAGTARQTPYLYAVMAGIATLALWALAQFFFLYGEYGPRIHHPFLDPNSLAGALNLALLPALAFFMTADTRRRAITAAIMLCLLYAALIVTQSRAGLLAALISSFIILLFLGRPLWSQKWRLAALVAGTAIIPLLLRGFGGLVHHRDLAKIILDGGTGSISDRAAIWHATLEMIREHPWGGTGLGSFSYFYGAHRLPADRSDGYFAHMDPLQLWAETGAGAFILFYAVIVAALARTVRALNHTDDVKTRVAILGPFGGMVALILHTHLNYHLYMPALQIPLGVMMAMWYAATASVLPGRKRALPFRRGRLAVLATFAIALAAANIWCLGAAVSSRYTAASAQALNTGDISAAKDNADSAMRWSPRSKPQVWQYQARWRILELQQRGGKMSVMEREKIYTEALSYMNESLRRQTQSPSLLADRARLYLTGKAIGLQPDGYERAADDLDAALAMDPINVGARMERAAIRLKNGELHAALGVLEEGLRWPRPKGQADINFLVTTARLRKQLGDDAGHDRLIAAALERAKAYGLTKPRGE